MNKCIDSMLSANLQTTNTTILNRLLYVKKKKPPVTVSEHIINEIHNV